MLGSRICVVDDNFCAGEALAMLFRHAGFEVSTALDSTSALELIMRERPAVAILDVVLRDGVGGYELATRVRAALGRSIRLIALTGRDRAEDVRYAIESGFDRHLSKPANAGELLAAVHEELRNR